jgi:hypothetical protein
MTNVMTGHDDLSKRGERLSNFKATEQALATAHGAWIPPRTGKEGWDPVCLER